MLSAGYSRDVTDAAIHLERYVRDVVTKWKEETARYGSAMSVVFLVMRKVSTTDFAAIQDPAALELQVRGLSSLAGFHTKKLQLV